jgi:hypothetical protein
MAKNHTTKPATLAAQTQIEAPFELQAQRQYVVDLQNRIKQLNADLNAAQNEARLIRAGGHDLTAPGVPADFVRKVQRDYPTPQTKLAADQFDLEVITPMRQQLRELELLLQRETAILSKDWSEFREANAPALAQQAAATAKQIEADIQNLEGQQHDLRGRITKINAIRLQRLEMQSKHDAAVAQALANGDSTPDGPTLPLVPAETPPQIERAIDLLSQQIEVKRDQLNAARTQHRAMMTLIDSQRAQSLIDSLVVEAKAEGVSLGTLRDKLVELAGETALSDVRADGEARANAQLRVTDARTSSLELALARANSQLERMGARQITVPADPARADAITLSTARHQARQQQSPDAMLTGRI